MMRETVRWTVLLAALLAPAVALADDIPVDEPDTAPHEFPLGQRTRDWLERQRLGLEASDAHGLTPPAEKRARKRYLQSFEHPIPDLFDTKNGEEKK